MRKSNLMFQPYVATASANLTKCSVHSLIGVLIQYYSLVYIQGASSSTSHAKLYLMQRTTTYPKSNQCPSDTRHRLLSYTYWASGILDTARGGTMAAASPLLRRLRKDLVNTGVIFSDPLRVWFLLWSGELGSPCLISCSCCCCS